MSRIAVIGSGIAGLAAAHLLSRKHEVFVFERDARIGGHTHTVVVESSRGPVAVDTGFIVHNQRTYPLFCRLMQQLGVATQPSDMSFAVTSPDAGFEYSSRGAAGFFAQRRNVLRVEHWSLFSEILRFNREAPRVLANPDPGLTLGQFLEYGRYSLRFIERYLYPMASAVWSMPQDELAGFPALTLIRFFHNHGMLGINTHPQWLTIRGGSHAYFAPLTAAFRNRLFTGTEITAVRRAPEGVTIDFRDRPRMTFDHVVFATHGNQILPLLPDATDLDRDVLGNFATTRNEATLHTDERMLPRRVNARASWNYLIGDNGKVTMTYHMNRLQALGTPEEYCVSLNANGSIAPERTLRRMIYYHPIYSRAAVRAQERWGEISGRDRVHFCGAYWLNGFHEDGVHSALRVANALGVEW